MIATNYTNRDVLYAAYTMSRDAMRRFIINCLKKNGDTPENLISKALPHESNKSITPHNKIEVAETIDIRDFPDLIITYWKNTIHFSEEFNPDSTIRTDTEKIKKGRKLWAHPKLKDADPGETRELLSLISKVLGEINEPDEKRKVDRLLNQLFPYGNEEHFEVRSNLEKVSKELITLKKYQEATDERLAAVEEYCANIAADTLNQLRTALVKPLESKEHSKNGSNQLTEVGGVTSEEPAISYPSSEFSNSTEVFNTLEVGQHLRGIVNRIIAEGVFVTWDKGKGFIPRSELSLKSINHPSDVVSVGEEVEITIINLNQQDSKKLPSLRLRSKHDEWKLRVDEQRYKKDSKIEVKIARMHDTHGAFVELEEGIEGLIHQSNMLTDCSKPLQEGQRIEVIISHIDFENEKIALHLPVEQKPIR